MGKLDSDIISKGELRRVLKNKILLTAPELQSKVTSVEIDKCIGFISGYIKCMEYTQQYPVNERDLKGLLIDECFEWLLSQLG